MSIDQTHDIIVIKRKGNVKKRSKVYEKEQESINKRFIKNKSQYSYIENKLNSLFNNMYKHKDAVLFAQQISKQFSIPLDRMAQRFKRCLICWFCENWTTIYKPILNQNETENNTSDVSEGVKQDPDHGVNMMEDFSDLCMFDEIIEWNEPLMRQE